MKTEADRATMTRAKNARNQQKLRQRRAAAGLVEARGLWLHPDDHALLKFFSVTLASVRAGK